jgi:hypothetical protein
MMFGRMADGGMWGGSGAMWGMGLGWLLLVILLILGIAALIKYLTSGRG